VVFAVTARHSGNTASAAAASLVTSSTTPTASSLFIVFYSSENNNDAGAPAANAPTGGGLTYTSIAASSAFNWSGLPEYASRGSAWRATVGGSPSAFAVTVSNGIGSSYYGAVCLDITGHDTTTPIVQSATGGASKSGGDAESGTVTLGAAPTAGNLIVVAVGAGSDSGGGISVPEAGSGKTLTAVTSQTNQPHQVGIWTRVADGTESATITIADLGQSVGNYDVVAFEVAIAGGGAAGTSMPFPRRLSRGLILRPRRRRNG
jgi:hypothetical protein